MEVKLNARKGDRVRFYSESHKTWVVGVVQRISKDRAVLEVQHHNSLQKHNVKKSLHNLYLCEDPRGKR